MAHVISALPLTTEESEADWSSRNCSSVLRGFFQLYFGFPSSKNLTQIIHVREMCIRNVKITKNKPISVQYFRSFLMNMNLIRLEEN